MGIGQRTSRARVRMTVMALAILEARRSLVCSIAISSGVSSRSPGMASRSSPASAAMSWSSALRIAAMEAQSYLSMPKMSVKRGVKIRGERSAMTFPANIGLLEPVQSTFKAPQVFLAVTSQAMTAQARPRGGVRVAAHLLWPAHIMVRVAGMTADEIMTPIIT